MNKLFASVALLTVFGCATPSTPTELIVVVRSEFAPVTELARVVVTTSDESGTTISIEELEIATAPSEESVELPFSFGIRPSGDPTRPVRLEVEGFAAGATQPFVMRRATVPFVVGERRQLSIFLERACEQSLCADREETCVGGACVDRNVPASALQLVTPGEELLADAGAPPPRGDAGPSCTEDPTCDEATDVEVGRGFACALRRSGRVACWGESAAAGQLGNGQTEPSLLPVEVVGVGDATAIAAGDDFVCTVSEITISCWGANDVGQLARAAPASSATAAVIEGPSIGTRLFVAARTACGTYSDSAALGCWGASLGPFASPLPDLCGETPCAHLPVEQPLLIEVSSMADEGHFCVAGNGGAACASSNAFGEVGDGTREPRAVPTVATGLAFVLSVSATTRGTCAIDVVMLPESEDLTTSLHCWGADDLGQIGDGGAAPDVCEGAPCALAPIAIDSIVEPAELAATEDTTCVRETAGRVLCWGSDANGGLGDGVGAPERCGDVPCARTPRPVRGLDAVDLDARAGTFCAVQRSGEILCWGGPGHADLPLPVGPLPR